MPIFLTHGQAIKYRLRQSKRAKRVSIRFLPAHGFEIVYPIGTTKRDAMAFFKRELGWVLNTWTKAQAQALDEKHEKKYFDGADLLYLGRSICLRLRDKGKEAEYRLRENALEITLPRRAHDDQDQLREILIEVYRREAKRFLPIRVWELAQRHGFAYNDVRVKHQKTRWGSCSDKGNINLNLRLMMAPEAAIDYVITHELCHLREMNHSRAFWSLVEDCCPDYRQWREWFKRNSASLVF